MSGLKIDLSLCKGCGRCVKVCAAGALKVENKKASVDEAKCIMCGMCKDSCKFDAISLEKDESGVSLADYHGVFVFAELSAEGPLPVAYELLGKGRTLADTLGVKLTAVAVGFETEKYAAGLIAHGADEVILCDDPVYKDSLEEPLTSAIVSLVQREKPEILLFGATMFGRSLAPRVAARLHTGLTADCTVLEIDAETKLLRQTRPAFGGNLMATIVCPNNRPQMATVRPGVMQALEADESRTGTVRKDTAPAAPFSGVELLEAVKTAKTESIKDAKIIVDAGRGVGSKKNLKLVKELAELLGGSLGVSRPLVDMGWSEYSHQIGQTGCTVAPDLLILCGVSGAIQHLAGISGAKKIIAINSDPDAPIFSMAHYKIVGDCMEIVQEMIRQLKAEG